MDRERIGPYRIERLLGSGGMGAVHLCWDERLSRWVAVKFIPDSSQFSEENRERLRREARAVAGLKHPAITQVYDIVQDKRREYIVMEYVEGVALSQIFARGRLSVDRAIHFGRQIAEGLKAAHDAGVVHRDLKAENIMITEDDEVKILDFGVAKRINADPSEESLTQEGVVMGTTRAMSPEQAEGRRVDQRSDIFSLGSLMYEMLTATHPFQHSSPLETMQRVVRHRPPPVSSLNRNVPPRLQSLIEEMMAKNRETRIDDAGAVAQRLSTIREEESDTIEILSAEQPRPRWLSSPWAPLVAGLIVAAIVIATLAL